MSTIGNRQNFLETIILPLVISNSKTSYIREKNPKKHAFVFNIE